jgi:hypothetical protein
MAEQFLVRWKCPDCGATKCGWIGLADFATRYCAATPKRKHVSGEQCCLKMDIVYDERPAGGNETAQHWSEKSSN